MSSISAIALSGMMAATRRLEATASNVANVRSTGALPAADGTVPAGMQQPYTPVRVDQTDVSGGGTATSVGTVTPSYTPMADPQSPFANADGLVAAPNVDLSQEMVGLMIARYTFTANVRVMEADDRMAKTLLDAKI